MMCFVVFTANYYWADLSQGVQFAEHKVDVPWFLLENWFLWPVSIFKKFVLALFNGMNQMFVDQLE